MACLALFHANGRPIVEIDAIAAPYAAFAVALRGSVDLRDVRALDPVERALVKRPDGGRVSRYPPGSTFVAVPLAAPFAWIYGEPLRPSRMRRLGKWVASICCAAAVVLFALTCRGLAPGAVAPATVLLAAGTTVWSVASQSLWTHGPALLWVALGMAIQWRGAASRAGPAADRCAAAAGLAFGLAVFTRPTTLLLAAVGPLALAADRRRREAGLCILATAVPVALLLLYDQLQFGAPFAGGYGTEAARFDTPVWTGLLGLLVAPSRGLFVYSPALVLAPLGGVAVWRRRAEGARGSLGRALLLGWSAAAFATLLLYARWHAWAGGWCFGPRFLTETLPVWGLLFALAIRHRLEWGAVRRFLLGALVALSIAIHAVGVFGHGNDWNARHEDAPNWFSWSDTQIAAHARHLVARITGAVQDR